MPCVGIERPLPPTPNSESLPPTEIQALHLGLLHGASTRREIPGPSLPPSVSLSAPGHQQHPLPCDNLHLCFPYQAESIPEGHLTLQPWAPVGSRLIGHGKRLGLLSSSSDLLRCPLNRKKVPLQVHLLHSIPTHCPQFRAYFHPGTLGCHILILQTESSVYLLGSARLDPRQPRCPRPSAQALGCSPGPRGRERREDVCSPTQ